MSFAVQFEEEIRRDTSVAIRSRLTVDRHFEQGRIRLHRTRSERDHGVVAAVGWNLGAMRVQFERFDHFLAFVRRTKVQRDVNGHFL